MNITEKPKHPKGLYVLFFTEMWERFGFYTMLAIFTLYLDEFFHFENKGQLYGGFLALVYFTPIGGGYVADKLLGFRRTIALGAVLMAIGYAMIAVPFPQDQGNEAKVKAAEQQFAQIKIGWEERSAAAKKRGEKFEEKRPKYSGPVRTDGRWLFFLALFVLVLGNGLFKPNISVMVGNLYKDGDPLKDSAFSIFYMGINIGAFFAPMAAAGLRKAHGWSAAFGAAATGMLVSLAIFVLFKKHIMHAEIGGSTEGSVVDTPQLSPERYKARVWALLIIFAIVVLFWMSFHQNGFTLTLWARDCTGPLWGNFRIPPEIYQSVNPFFVVTLTPLLVLFWNALRKRGMEPSTPGKIGVGMVLTAAAFGVMAMAGLAGGDTGLVSPLWLVTAYGVVTLGELCLSPMGLSFVSKVAPPSIRGLMMGGWFGATAVGNYLSGAIEPLWHRWPHSQFFGFLVLTSLFAGLLLRLVLNRLKKATAD